MLSSFIRHASIIIFFSFIFVTSSFANLSGRDLDHNVTNGFEAYYDSALNITWLADANIGLLSMNSIDGSMQANKADAFVSQFVVNDISGWRLPRQFSPPGGMCHSVYGGRPDSYCGYNSSPNSSELAYMFFENLGNTSSIDVNGIQKPGISSYDWGLVNVGPFRNLINGAYWSSTQNSSVDRWVFDNSTGYQDVGLINPCCGGYKFHLWAVHDGDVLSVPSIPEPESATLACVGLVFMWLLKKRQ